MTYYFGVGRYLKLEHLYIDCQVVIEKLEHGRRPNIFTFQYFSLKALLTED